jgi:two-component system phosphate regulon response regulator PhoB/two-component system alkaline phosphatase synthesis response regulator PhoP/two-component system response regulator VicR
MKNKILLIDDDEDLIRSFQVMLESKGFDVITSSNGKDGYTKLKNENPDLLVLDVMMNTDLEGYNLLHVIKQEPVFKKIPIILLTGMIDKLGVNLVSGVEDETMLPNVHFQDKPIDPQVLVKMIQDLLTE